MAALLKAYTPVTWARLDDLIVDDPGVARKLGKTIRPYSTVPSSHDRMILLAILSQDAGILGDQDITRTAIQPSFGMTSSKDSVSRI